MLETIETGLIVALVSAIVSAITFVAYKHPQSYRQFYNPLWIVVAAAWFGRMIYRTGFGNGFSYAVNAVRDANKDKLIVWHFEIAFRTFADYISWRFICAKRGHRPSDRAQQLHSEIRADIRKHGV